MISNVRFSPIWSPIIILGAIIISTYANQTPTHFTVFLPEKYRAEGRLTLSQVKANQSTKHIFGFTETVDVSNQRAKISIGYIGYKPTNYHMINNEVLTLDKDGKCKQLNDRVSFIPEVDWFVQLRHSYRELNEYLHSKPFLNGPSGLVSMLMRPFTKVQYQFERREDHRNIRCRVYSGVTEGDVVATMKTEIFWPDDESLFKETQVQYFSLRQISKNIAGDGQLEMTIDYFNIERMADDQHRLERLAVDLNLPTVAGCSKYLWHLKPSNYDVYIMMSYYQASTNSLVMMAFDSVAGLLRKETIGRDVKIWDFRDSLLYQINSRGVDRLSSNEPNHNNNIQTVDLEACSVLTLSDDKVGPAYKPFKSIWNIMTFIGADEVALIGHGTVRDIPCFIYESVLDEPPLLFGSTAESIDDDNRKQYEYIVQFFVMKSLDLSPKDMNKFETKFWPSRIVLWKRHKESGQVIQIDQLEVNDYHHNLDGWSQKSLDLFMASECFDDHEQQVRITASVTFDQLKGYGGHNLLLHHKYLIEDMTIHELIRGIGADRMHLAEYNVKFMPTGVDVSLVLADISETKDFEYIGKGELAYADSYINNRVVLNNLDEQDCVSIGSLIVDISMVIYCPHSSTSTCTAVYDEQEPLIETNKQTISDENVGPFVISHACKAFRFRPRHWPPKQALSNWHQWTTLLRDRTFLFQLPDVNTTIKGILMSLDVKQEVHLITLDKYAFAMDNQLTESKSVASNETEASQVAPASKRMRSFDTITYLNVGDCEKMCNLDVSCKSYSYCPNLRDSNRPRCVLASLDLRASAVPQQVALSRAENNRIKVKSSKMEGAQYYELELASGCQIYERNYLDMFSQTDEVVRMKRLLALQFHVERSPYECARWALKLEQSEKKHNISLFAYCPATNGCLVDENLFRDRYKPTSSNRSSESNDENEYDDLDQDDDSNGAKDVKCFVYRKRYQAYFHVSSKVMVEDRMQQVELKLNTVEECATACWHQLGDVCASFDYCSPQRCLVNKLSLSTLDNDELVELRPNCLHYERDLELDKLRKDHDLARHVILAPEYQSSSSPTGFGVIVMNAIIMFFVSISFLVGLLIGQHVNDRLEKVTILRQSISLDRPGLRPSQMFHWSMFGVGRGHDIEASMDQPDEDSSNRLAGASNVIYLEEINSDRVRVDHEDPDGKPPANEAPKPFEQNSSNNVDKFVNDRHNSLVP